MTIEEYVISYLSEALNPGATETVIVSGSTPHPLPEVFVTVELTGEQVADLVPTAQIHINAYSRSSTENPGSRAEAAALGRQIYAAMAAMAAEPEISRVGLESMYNDTDLELDRPREAEIYRITYLFMED